ncbi:hypothetical protein NE237_025994 [Protea cynaroides]|uniref:F-box domain-containing protein n=1 Tax=Protea cynaroides TaxID=273540 RepID=A0A9Q0H5V6_9MAGN|nr:hypothetical protein NE237_025994 [Protea cynaroides]
MGVITNTRTSNRDDDDASNTTEMNLLPHNIIFDIWNRLPIVSTLRFMSVCKLWYSLLGDHESHDKWMVALHQLPYLFFFFFLKPSVGVGVRGGPVKMNSLLMVNGDGGWKSREMPMGFELKSWLEQNHEIMGSCNGFLCIAPEQGHDPVFFKSHYKREDDVAQITIYFAPHPLNSTTLMCWFWLR